MSIKVTVPPSLPFVRFQLPRATPTGRPPLKVRFAAGLQRRFLAISVRAYYGGGTSGKVPESEALGKLNR